jgi:ubiquinone/menaquinone biosynthesis C-methylase UbiE
VAPAYDEAASASDRLLNGAGPRRGGEPIMQGDMDMPEPPVEPQSDGPQDESWAAAAKREARKQWDHDPAGSVAVEDDPLGTPESFRKVEAHRYAEQPWMHDTFHYDRYRGQRVLEIGVGLGTDHLQFARAGARLTGIDLTQRCIDLTAARFEQERLESRLIQMDAEGLEFEEDSFDAVYSFGVLHHTPSPERAFREVRRVLRPGGVFIGGLYNERSAFYARVRLERLVRMEFLHETLEHRRARIEHSTSDAVPLVRLFTARELRALLRESGFPDVRLTRRHLGLGRFTDRLPTWIERGGGRLAGWYLVHTAR